MSRGATGTRAVLVVLAKAPVPGLAKTRLCPPATAEQAARIASAALLDTLDAVRAVPATRTVVALTGVVADAVGADELDAVLASCDVVDQRGDALGERIAAAHADAAALHPGLPTVQIGMDTPQVTPGLLEQCLDRLAGPADAVLGPATDGGWWVLGLRDPRAAQTLVDVPTSRSDTGELTARALRSAGLRVASAPELTDVDTAAEAVAVASRVPGGRFARVVDELGAAFRERTPA